MKVKLDDEVLFEIDERMVKLLAHDLLDPMGEIKRRLQWVIEHKCERCFERIKQEWTDNTSGPSKLEQTGVTSIPVRKTDLVDLIFSLPEYKNRQARKDLNSQ